MIPRLLGNGNYTQEVEASEVIHLWKEWLRYVPRKKLGAEKYQELYKEFEEWLHDYYDVVDDK